MSQQYSADIRLAAVAGQFYPDSPAALRAAIEEAFLSPLGPGTLPEVADGPRRLVGVVAPHAGYLYSAAGAAWSFAAVARDGRPAAVAILGVNHHGYGAPLALSPAAGWETPLGVMPLATELGARLQALDPEVKLDAVAHEREHSLEVQVPFLQYLFGALPILPIAFGMVGEDTVFALGQALAAMARETDLLIVASTDFSHYISKQAAEERDALALARIVAVDPRGLFEVVRGHNITMCGVLPVTALLAAAQAQGVREGEVLHYHTSGDVTGDMRQVVGYGSAVLARS